MPFPDHIGQIGKTIWSSPAGKKRLAKTLAAIIPEHRVYVEPFAGSAAVLFAKDASEVEVINDIDPEITFAFKAIQTLTDDEFEQLEKKEWIGSKDLYSSLRTSEQPVDKVDRLHRFLYVSGFAFGGVAGSEARAGFNPAQEGSRLTSTKRIEKFRDRLKDVEVLTGSYLDTVKKYDAEDAFFFLDPPYVGHDAMVGENAFDEEEFVEALKEIKGKFLVTYTAKSEIDTTGFHVKKIESRHTAPRSDGKPFVHLLISNYEISEQALKALEEDFSANSMVKGFPSGNAEAGIHVHAIDRDNSSTKFDGAHTHLFVLPDGTLVVTNEDGEHEHKIFSHDEDSEHIGWDGEHVHALVLPDGTELRTEIEGFHDHEMQVETTAFDGGHTHRVVTPEGRVLTSLTPREFWRLQGEPSQEGNPEVPPASELARVAAKGDTLAGLRSFDAEKAVIVLQDGNLYVHAGGDLRKSAEAAIAQMLSADAAKGVKILGGPPDLSRPHVEIADLVVKMRDRFEVTEKREEAEKRIEQNEDGEYCVIAETTGRNFGCFPTKGEAEDRLDQIEQFSKGLPDVLTWGAVMAKRMPASGSGLPASLETAVPPAYRYWKAGDRARGVRDALVESGFFTSENVAVVNDQLTRILTKRFISPDQPDADAEFARPQSFAEVIAIIVKRGCAMWSIDDAFPTADDAKEFPDSVIVLDPAVTKRWLQDGKETADSLVRKSAALELPILIAAPDSLGSRIAFSRFGRPFTIQKCSTANLVFVSNFVVKGVQSVAIEEATLDQQRQFTLSQQVWKDGKSVWHLFIDRHGEGLDGWTLQASPIGKAAVAGIQRNRSSKVLLDFDGGVEAGGSIGGEPMNDSSGDSAIWIADRGRAVVVDKTEDGMKVRFEGAKLRGVFTIEGQDADSIWKIARAETAKAIAKSYRVGEFIIAKAEEERFVYGIVLEPETVDAQKDIYSADEVRTAAHKFMAEFQNIGIQHTELAKQVRILESFLAPADFSVGERVIKAGTWLLAVRVLSDALWKDVKAGDFTGFSIGGSAIRRPE
jgi:site-specific DNA-adenine methylase